MKPLIVFEEYKSKSHKTLKNYIKFHLKLSYTNKIKERIKKREKKGLPSPLEPILFGR